MITSKTQNADPASLPDKKLLYDFGKEMFFVVKVPGFESSRDRSLFRFFNSHAIMASGIPTRFLSSDPIELCNKLELFLKKRQVIIPT